MVEPVELQSEFAHFGTVLEPVVKKEFMERTGLKVRAKHMLLQSTEHEFMLADLDGVINDNGELVIFEAKTSSAYRKAEWEKGVPFEYILQVNHYMFIVGAKRAYVAAIVGGQHYFQYEVLRDDVLISKIIAAEKKFWEENVLARKEPEPDGSAATTAFLNEKYTNSNGNSIELPVDALQVLKRYDEVSVALDRLETMKEEICNQLKVYLQENEHGYIADRHVSWTKVQSTRFDKKRLEAEQPEIYKDYVRTSQYRRLSVA